MSEGGPPNADNWQLAFEDDFDSGTLDTSKWSAGWGWGMDTTIGSEHASERAISFGDSTVELSILNEGPDYPVGAINTKNKVTYGPGSYLEAKVRVSDLPGLSSNFWGKPNSEAWPPEIDFMEVPIYDSSDVDRSIHHIHWSTDGQPNGPHADLNVGTHTGADKSQNWTIFGCRWLESSVTYYVNGQELARTDRSDVMTSVNNGAPFYLMLDVLNWPGADLHPDSFSGYKPTHEVDWVRLWEPGSGGGSGGGSTDDGDSTDGDGSTDDSTEHYLWVRSSNGEPATFSFTASGGNIRLDSSGHEADFWIAEDGTSAGGTVEKWIDIPGFWYEGSITDFSYEGPLEVYIDDEYVDPDTLVSETSGSDGSDGSDSDQDGSTSLPNELTIDGSAHEGTTTYSVSVSESIEPTADAEGADSVSGTTATGSVSTGADTYGFSGSITSITVDGGVDVYRNGTRVNLLRIERDPGSSGSVTYLVESSGRLLKADVPSASINGNDRLDGSKAFGRVVGGQDAYWLVDGDIVDVSTFGGEVVTTLDGQTVDYAD